MLVLHFAMVRRINLLNRQLQKANHLVVHALDLSVEALEIQFEPPPPPPPPPPLGITLVVHSTTTIWLWLQLSV